MSETVLQKISEAVKLRLENRKMQRPILELEKKIPTFRTPFQIDPLFIEKGLNVISEVKFRSPAVGELKVASESRAVQIASEYWNAGACVISVLTEEDYFHGNIEYLKSIRKALPEAKLLMKDFILEEYQILEALEAGADLILLILSLLGKSRAESLMVYAKRLGLSVLVEVHDADELSQAHDMGATLIGINNRNLKTLEVSLKTSFELIQHKKNGVCYISESGIHTKDEIHQLLDAGFSGFLMGSVFMSEASPGVGLKRLIEEVTSR